MIFVYLIGNDILLFLLLILYNVKEIYMNLYNKNFDTIFFLLQNIILSWQMTNKCLKYKTEISYIMKYFT